MHHINVRNAHNKSRLKNIMGSRGARGAAVAVAVLQLAVLLSPPASAAPLSLDFHAASCPQLESIVLSSVQAALQKEIALAAGLLRIFFHDCFPQGCDASVYLNGTGSEQLEGANLSLQPRALKLVDDIRAKVHAACGPTVSCADISALATRDAVVVSGGPSYSVLLGQLDSLAPASSDLVGKLPNPSETSVRVLLSNFRTAGLGEPADLVALSGGHTVGRAQCIFRRPVDDAFSGKLENNCTVVNPKRLQELDVITPDAFDNGYYIALTTRQGVFSSDMALIRDPSTAPIVRQFAQDKASFFAQFAKSMIKLSNAPRPGGNVGEIRRRCFSTNGPRLVADA
ncbi:hypothetical protein GUJ93_ZPchr0152g29207 [Zizania palustris]|uniref:Plant heme peroxidase family profile domain-containing protein n=1 Tax=Zizania palustris TaxID=103762 RepID=A0A8J5R7Q8_ZIZPA|nr:hypothetical protein GUJ93_ZPchr0458g22644 [Zizania palustris]KAG8044625.1 hypothetical protein GUJ93_ZPchr0152g29207 [Zizania palustris]